MRHEYPTDESRAIAALHCLGALGPEEERAFEEHLARGCPVCEAELEAFGATTGELGFLANPADPPADLRNRILERIGRGPSPTTPSSPIQVWRRWNPSDTPSSDSYLQRSDEGKWEETGMEGISVRKLFVDSERQQVTMLVRMAPGTSYPPHRHGAAEECYVLEGDLRVGDVVMEAGDYQRVEESSVHGVQSSKDGCLLFILSSLHDEILA